MKTLAGLLAAVTACLLTGPSLAQATRLPDTEVTSSGGVSAWLIDPTTRYGHAVLGDAIEAGGFAVSRGGATLTYTLDAKSVFEDRRVRLADIDGDGLPEAILVKAYLDRGAAIAVYKILPTRIVALAESAPIGKRHRWLNILGAGNFSGSGETTIAAIVTPHLSGSLRFYRREGARLVEIARKDGYTSHIIGSRDIDLGRVHDIDGDGAPDILAPASDRRALAGLAFRGGVIRELFSAPTPGRIVSLDKPARDRVAVTLEEGQRMEIAFPTR